MGFCRKFTEFMKLPFEVRTMIYAWSHGYDQNAANITIPININRHVRFRYSNEDDIFPNEIYYNYSLSLHQDGVPSNTRRLAFPNSESWVAYRRRFPNQLELNNGVASSQIVRFDANRDTIFMGLESLVTLGDYATPFTPPYGHGAGFGPSTAVRHLQLRGFRLIQRLSTPMRNPLVEGLAMLRREIFTSLTDDVQTDLSFQETQDFNAVLKDPAARWNRQAPYHVPYTRHEKTVFAQIEFVMNRICDSLNDIVGDLIEVVLANIPVEEDEEWGNKESLDSVKRDLIDEHEENLQFFLELENTEAAQEAEEAEDTEDTEEDTEEDIEEEGDKQHNGIDWEKFVEAEDQVMQDVEDY